MLHNQPLTTFRSRLNKIHSSQVPDNQWELKTQSKYQKLKTISEASASQKLFIKRLVAHPTIDRQSDRQWGTNRKGQTEWKRKRRTLGSTLVGIWTCMYASGTSIKMIVLMPGQSISGYYNASSWFIQSSFFGFFFFLENASSGHPHPLPIHSLTHSLTQSFIHSVSHSVGLHNETKIIT